MSDDVLAIATRQLNGVLGDAGERDIVWCASGTDALAAVLLALKEGKPDAVAPAVLLPACVCPQVLLAVMTAGLRPIVVSSASTTGGYSLALDAVRGVARVDALAFIWVHQYGAIAQTADVQRLCADKGWWLIEDAALCLGAQDASGQRAGTLGDIGIFSFGRGKVIDIDYGGAAVINNGDRQKALAPAVRAQLQRSQPSGHDLGLFDTAFKDAYNSSFESFSAGAMRSLGQLLYANRKHPAAPDAAQLSPLIADDQLACAPARAIERVARAKWWQHALEDSPLTALTHAQGTYWRQNILLPSPEERRDVLRAGLRRQIPISSWYPPLYWWADIPDVVGYIGEDEDFAARVVNVWVDEVGGSSTYQTAFMELLHSAVVRP